MLRGNMKACSLVSSVILLIAIEDAHAQSLPPHKTALGPAAQSCRNWIQERQKLRHTGTWDSDLKFMSAWVTGYLTGANEAMIGTGKQDVLSATHTDLSSTFAWIDNYCNGQPLSSIFDASESLMTELRKRAR
jgi:hypothetical protein